MNAFTNAVNIANVAGAKFGYETTMAIFKARDKDATKEEILGAVVKVNRMIADTKRVITMMSAILELRNTAKLTFEAWWELFKEVNPRGDSTCPEFNTALDQLHIQIDNSSLSDRMQYFWDEAFPAVVIIDDIVPTLNGFVAELEVCKTEIEKKRKSVM